jgi:hypothetical protein
MRATGSIFNLEIIRPDPNEKSRTGETTPAGGNSATLRRERPFRATHGQKNRRKSLSGGHYHAGR